MDNNPQLPSGTYFEVKPSFKIIQGHPVVSSNGYLHGKIDAIIEIHIEYTPSSKEGTLNVLKLVIDAKPKLNRISSTLDQIDAYVRLLDFDKDYKNIEKRMKMVVTYDTNGRFDSMLTKQGMSAMSIGRNVVWGCYRCGRTYKVKPFLVPNIDNSSYYDEAKKICDTCKEYVDGYDPEDLEKCHYCQRYSDYIQTLVTWSGHGFYDDVDEESESYNICDNCCYNQDICEECPRMPRCLKEMITTGQLDGYVGIVIGVIMGYMSDGT